MKKSVLLLAAGLIGVFVLLSAGRAAEDPFEHSYGKYAVGAPNAIFPSGGRYYGQIFNSASSDSWSLGFGASKNTNGTSALTWASSGLVTVPGTLTVTGEITATGGVVGAVTGAISGNVTGAASLNVLKAGDTMTGTLSAPRLTLTYGIAAATAAFSGAITLSGALKPYQLNSVALRALAPAVGDVYVCKDCTYAYTLVVGTGTGAGQFRQPGTALGIE